MLCTGYVFYGHLSSGRRPTRKGDLVTAAKGQSTFSLTCSYSVFLHLHPPGVAVIANLAPGLPQAKRCWQQLDAGNHQGKSLQTHSTVVQIITRARRLHDCSATVLHKNLASSFRQTIKEEPCGLYIILQADHNWSRLLTTKRGGKRERSGKILHPTDTQEATKKSEIDSQTLHVQDTWV